MSQAGRELSAPAGTGLPEVDPSHQASQPGGAANFSRGTAPAALLGKTLGFCLCTRESCFAGAPSTTGDVSVSRGPALMPCCVAGNEFTLYSMLSIPAAPLTGGRRCCPLQLHTLVPLIPDKTQPVEQQTQQDLYS